MKIVGCELDKTGFVSCLKVKDTDGQPYSVVIEYNDDTEERRFDVGTGPGKPFSDEIMKQLADFCDRVEGRT